MSSYPFKQLSQDYEALLESNQQSDVVLVTDDGNQLFVHKLVLSTRSPVFGAMFAHDTTNRVDIPDVDFNVLQLLIKYIYTGKIKFLDLNMEKVLVAADKYKLNCLKSICEQLLRNINTESAVDLLNLADEYSATRVTIACLDFMSTTDNAAQVIAHVSWAKVSPRMAAQLCKFAREKYPSGMKRKVDEPPSSADMSCVPGSIFEQMSQDYEALLESGQLWDVDLVTADGKSLRAHKLVLSTRSPVFADMFAHDTTNRVDIPDVDFDDLQLLIKYIYTGKFKFLDLNVKVQVLAGKYQACLKTICERLLAKIDIESAVDLLILADQYCATRVISACLDYIHNNATQVMAHVSWNKLSHRLLSQLCKYIVIKSTRA